MKDKPRPGHPCSVSTPAKKAELRAAIDQDRRSSIRNLIEKCGLNRNTTHKIVKKDFKMTKVAPKFVPHVLTEEMKKIRKDLSNQNLQLFRDDPQLLSKIVTGDESYFPLFDIETKIDSMQWKTTQKPCPTKALHNRSEKKTMLTCFFDEKGSILTEFCPVGDAVNAENYMELLKKLKERIQKKRPLLWERQDPTDSHSWRQVYIHQDNASPHTATISLTLMGESDLLMLPHPPYSPDLAPCDFFLFPYLKRQLHGQRFRTLPDLQAEIKKLLRQMDLELFQKAMLELPVRWKKCVLSDGAYFEGQHVRGHGEVVEVTDDDTESED